MSSVEVIDDTNPIIRYDPGNAWQLSTAYHTFGPYNGTVHATTLTSAKASIAFMGRSVSFTCLSWPSGSNFTATLDGNLVGTYDTSVAGLDNSTVIPRAIFTIGDLDVSHTYTLVLEKTPNDPGWVSSLDNGEPSHFFIDSFTIEGTSESPSISTFVSQSSSSTTSNSLSQLPPLSTLTPHSQSRAQSPPSLASPASTLYSQSPSSSATPGTGAIAGIVFGVFVVITLIVAFVWYRRRLTRVARPSTSFSPFTEAVAQIDTEKPERVTKHIDSPSTILSSSTPAQEHGMAFVAWSSSPERGNVAEAGVTTTIRKSQFSGRNNSGTGSSLNPVASSVQSPLTPLPPSTALGEVNTSLVLQENAILRDQVRHFAALQRTGGLGILNGDEDHSGYHEPPPEYIGRESEEEIRT